MPSPLRIAYLYSRYPVVSQTFCDSEMMALEAGGVELTIGSLNPPPDSFRHERLDQIQADVIYPAPREVMTAPDSVRPDGWQRMKELALKHEELFGKETKPLTRAQNACYFAAQFQRRGVQHVHVHFANRATHTAIFLKEVGLTYSFTAHAQDFMVDLDNADLLEEMVRQSEFAIAVSDYSRNLLAEMCPGSEHKIHRLYNGIDLGGFSSSPLRRSNASPIRLLSVGRLIEFKGFHVLIDAVAELRKRGTDVDLEIVGDGPWRERLQSQIDSLDLSEVVLLRGVQSQDQIREKLSAVDAFVLACTVDSNGATDVLPTVITEAMASSLPVISTNLAGVPEMVEDGVTGLLAAPGDVDSLVTAMEKFANGDLEWRRALGVAGAEKAERNFDQQESASELERRFRAAIKIEGERAMPDCLLVIESCSAESRDRQELATYLRHPSIEVLSSRLGDADETEVSNACCGKLSFYPDGVVLESMWQARPRFRAEADRIRRELGSSVVGEQFYVAARRAIWLGEMLKKREISNLHAFRSDSALVVWLAKQLCNKTLTISAVIEPGADAGRSILRKLLVDFDRLSIADRKLAEEIGAKDVINLESMKNHQHRRVGPLKIRQPQPTEEFNKSVSAWAEFLCNK